MILIDRTLLIAMFFLMMWCFAMFFLIMRIEENKRLKEEIEFLKKDFT